jgi:hypothetical protein
MPCYLLHMVEQPDPDPYADKELKDLVGSFPRFFCTKCDPPRTLMPAETVKCLERQDPCWKPVEQICAD